MENSNNPANSAMSQEMAEKEVSAWLDYKRVKQVEREKNEQFVKILVEAVKCGDISIDTAGDFTITHKLIFPEPGGTFTQLKYKARAKTGAIQAGTKNLDGIGMRVYQAYAQELTGVLMGQLSSLDTEDFKILQAITTFFL